MPKQKLPLVVRIEPVFVRDAQRRLRLVIELLEQEAIREQSAAAQPQPELPRALTVAQSSARGTR